MIGDYIDFLDKLLAGKYKFIFFSELDNSDLGQVTLRHDIDHNCSIAFQMAKIEYSKNIKSTYFFLLTNNSYNLLSFENYKIVKKIKELGHKISLHFDPTIYDDINSGLLYEKNIFEETFGVKIDIISLHKPLPDHLNKNLDSDLIDFTTTYDNKFFVDTKYFADSRGSFRFGNPLESSEFKLRKNIQILIHPIWWIGEGNDKFQRVEWMKKVKFKLIDENLSDLITFYEG